MVKELGRFFNYFDLDIYVFLGMFNVVFYVFGVVKKVVEFVFEDKGFYFVFVRLLGYYVGRKGRVFNVLIFGFCIFNNVVYVLKFFEGFIGKVLVIDFDVYYGNGM